MKESARKKIYAVALIFVLLISVLLAGCKADEVTEEETAESAPPPPASNPLTGEPASDGFDESALNRRVVAFVVENSPDARPQWGMDDPEYSPDIICQGEVEGGITRTLWLYADYNKLPAQIGPMRSARPPYILFSELFDSIFIHWGQSYSKGDYVGANSIFEWHAVDHINQMDFDDKEGMYDRDHSRDVSAEHTGIVYGDKVPKSLKNAGFRLEPKEYTKLYFYEDPTPVSEEAATAINVTYSEQADWETTDWEYNEEDQKYHCTSFRNDLVRDNLIVLYDETEYVTKENYHGSGSSVVYCDYHYKGGRGQLFSKGTVKEIQWKRKAGKLMLIDPDKNAEEIMTLNSDEDTENDDTTGILAEVPLKDEEKAEAEKKAAAAEEAGEEYHPEMYVVQPINKGKTWIGLISSNNGGSVNITGSGN